MPWTCLCMLSDRECILRFTEFDLSTGELVELRAKALHTSSPFLARAAPVEHQSSADERGRTAHKFCFKESLVLSTGRNGRQNHRARSNQECERSGNPDARHAARDQRCMAIGAVWPMRQLDSGSIHIKERNEIQN